MAMSSDMLACVEHLQKASESENRLSAVKDALKGMIQRPMYTIEGDLISARIEGAVLQIRVDGPGRFRTYSNHWSGGGSVAAYSDGKHCDSSELIRELIDFEGLRKGI